jgi:hypothetical protein
MKIHEVRLTILLKRAIKPRFQVVHGMTASRAGSGPAAGVLGVIARSATPQILFVAALLILSANANSQTLANSYDYSDVLVVPLTQRVELPYQRPNQKTMISNYRFDTFGPYPVAGSAFAAGINQFSNSTPEWRQGIAGYSKRFGSDFAIAAVGTTTRYGLARFLREDTLYYRCECSGLFPRIRHAMISTLTSRRGIDGHRVFSIPAFVSPYVGSSVAIYGWYPDRFGAKDALRIGNYNLLSTMGGNITLEFFYSGPHSLLSRMHLNNTHGSPIEGPNK